MSLSRKLTLIATFACGLFTSIFGALRLQEIVTIDSNDYTYSIANAMTYSALEPALAMVLACIPTLRPLLPPRSRQSSRAATGRTSIKWRLHPSLITFGGSGKPQTRLGNKTGTRGAIRLDDHFETGSGCELTTRPPPKVGAEWSEETVVGNMVDSQDGCDIETGVWVENDWKIESQRY